MKRTKIIAAVGALAAVASVVVIAVASGQASADPATAAHAGAVQCPGLGQPAITTPDGTVCSNVSGTYIVTTDAPRSAAVVPLGLGPQLTLAPPYFADYNTRYGAYVSPEATPTLRFSVTLRRPDSLTVVRYNGPWAGSWATLTGAAA